MACKVAAPCQQGYPMLHVWSEETCSLPCIVRPLYSNGLDLTIAKIHSQPMWMRATVHRACAVKAASKRTCQTMNLQLSAIPARDSMYRSNGLCRDMSKGRREASYKIDIFLRRTNTRYKRRRISASAHQLVWYLLCLILDGSKLLWPSCHLQHQWFVTVRI